MTEELRISVELAEEMVAHCHSERPNEACGVLGARDGTIVTVRPMRNAEASPVRYSLDTKEQYEVVYKQFPEEGLELFAVYHSHTRTEAYPSPTDVRLASEDVPYVIVSLASEPVDIRAFRIVKVFWTDETGEIGELAVVVD